MSSGAPSPPQQRRRLRAAPSGALRPRKRARTPSPPTPGRVTVSVAGGVEDEVDHERSSGSERELASPPTAADAAAQMAAAAADRGSASGSASGSGSSSDSSSNSDNNDSGTTTTAAATATAPTAATAAAAGPPTTTMVMMTTTTPPPAATAAPAVAAAIPVAVTAAAAAAPAPRSVPAPGLLHVPTPTVVEVDGRVRQQRRRLQAVVSRSVRQRALARRRGRRMRSRASDAHARSRPPMMLDVEAACSASAPVTPPASRGPTVTETWQSVGESDGGSSSSAGRRASRGASAAAAASASASTAATDANPSEATATDVEASKDMALRIRAASVSGDAAALRALLATPAGKAVVSVGVGQARWTALHWACFHGHADCVRALLDAGADRNHLTLHNWSPLYAACMQGHSHIVDMLAAAGCELTRKVRVPLLETPVHCASYTGPVNCLNTVLDVAAREPEDSWRVSAMSVDLAREAPIHKAAVGGQVECVRRLLNERVSVGVRGGKYLWPPATFAAIGGHTDILRLLHEMGDRTSYRAYGPLHAAAKGKHVESVKFLLSIGLCANRRDKAGWTPLHFAARAGALRCSELLLEAGADVHTSTNDKWSPLHFAAHHGYPDLLRLFLRKGARLNVRTGHEWSPLHHSACLKSSECTVLLLAAGADVEAVTNHNNTPLHCAAARGTRDTVTALLLHGASPNAVNCEGDTPLHCAARRGFPDCVLAMWQGGGSLTHRHSTGGLTPLQVLGRTIFGTPPASAVARRDDAAAAATSTAADATDATDATDASAPAPMWDMSQMFLNPQLADMSFVLDSGREVVAHRAYVIQHSHYFRSLFLGTWSESGDTKVPVKDVAEDVFLRTLRFMYTSTLDATATREDVFAMWRVAERFVMASLCDACEAWVVRRLHSGKDILDVFRFAIAEEKDALAQASIRFAFEHHEAVGLGTAGDDVEGRAELERMLRAIRRSDADTLTQSGGHTRRLPVPSPVAPSPMASAPPTPSGAAASSAAASAAPARRA